MIKFLQQPFPFVSNAKAKWRIIIGFSLFVIFFISIFELGVDEGIDHPLINVGFGVITMFVMFINRFVLPFFFPRFFSDEEWNVWKEILFHLWNLFLIGFANLLYANWGGVLQITIANLIRVQVSVIMVGIFPITILVLLKQIWLLKKYTAGAHDLNVSMQSSEIPSDTQASLDQPIYLSSESPAPFAGNKLS